MPQPRQEAFQFHPSSRTLNYMNDPKKPEPYSEFAYEIITAELARIMKSRHQPVVVTEREGNDRGPPPLELEEPARQ